MQFILEYNLRLAGSSSITWFLVIGQLLYAFSFVLVAFSLMPTEKERFLKMQKRFEEETAEKTEK